MVKYLLYLCLMFMVPTYVQYTVYGRQINYCNNLTTDNQRQKRLAVEVIAGLGLRILKLLCALVTSFAFTNCALLFTVVNLFIIILCLPTIILFCFIVQTSHDHSIMTTLTIAVLTIMAAALCCSSLTTAAPDFYGDKQNVLQVEGFGTNEEIKETNSIVTKCYDEETKSTYKVDSIWYPVGKCEKRTCSRQKNSKTPTIKTMECEPCTSCKLPNHTCQPFRSDKNYPKCCSQCLSKSTVLLKTEPKKKYQNI